ncbi:primosomal protein N' [Planctomyces sp. SH-PL62]|uniref:replication restart helicase PriA n=1 Tax=Planctomyces sp. SH-PL62 TaxID=1636152 RepID=UPI00078EB06D|nr:primosomal protein N' [Planctomyces sp. SH-PL62]AMV35928.1 Primosomal protein N' [Planctomyces sp. SH-PL62]
MSVVNQDDRDGEAARPSGRLVRPPSWFGGEDVAPAERGGLFIEVVVNRAFDQALTYGVPRKLVSGVQVGQRVRVPLGKRGGLVTGYCVSVGLLPPEGLDPSRIKNIAEILDPVPLIDARMLELTRWMAGYYLCSWGQALDAVVPAGVRNQAGTRIGTFLVVPPETLQAWRDGTLEATLTAKQAAAIDAVCRAEGDMLTVSDVCRRAKCGPGVVAGLRRDGRLHTVKRRLALDEARKAAKDEEADATAQAPAPAAAEATEAKPRLALTPEQQEAMDALSPALQGDAFAPFLVFGVTGSGKTEVYLSAIEQVVARGREAIVLVPEISLTPQTIRRFKRRFRRVAVLHSHLSDVERHRHWRNIARGEIDVVVGARSAIFAPTRRLGLIVVDEEHESTFKQETAPRYHARDVAVKRAHLESVPVMLGSATPSLESWSNAERGRYTKIDMPSRVEGRPMPAVELIDLRHEKHMTGGLSDTLRLAIHQALDDDGQVILLLNRRGYNTFIICPKCGEVVKCRHCDVAATFHKGRRLLICHMCDAERPCPPACPSCHAPVLHYGGIGTERLEREVAMEFPFHAARRMDSDTMRRHGSHEEALAAFKSGEVRILLGTQMIAKGLDFPNVTLVGVVDADVALHLPDFRAAERTFQLVAQVAGRTGRGDRKGRVLVQTYSPESPAILHAARHDYESFVTQELPHRSAVLASPYGRIVRLLARGRDEGRVKAYLDELTTVLRAKADPSVRFLGPCPAPVLKIKEEFRFHLQLRCATPGPLRSLLHDLSNPPLPPKVELAVDVDPVGML